jgi:outer membrane protein TolC
VEARSLYESASATEASQRRQALARTEERLIRIRQLVDEARFDSEALLVQDRLSVDAALASYRTGAVPFVTVLEALSTTFTDRRGAVARLADLLRAEADLREFSLDGNPSSAAVPKSPALSAGATPRM